MHRGDMRFFRECISDGCSNPVKPPRRKCTWCLNKTKMTRIQGKAVTKGANARGVCLHKPDKSRTKRAKRQNTGGLSPTVSSTRWAD